MTKVSVIIPVYKVPLEYLRACLDSLIAQTLQECEFIVVSDQAPEPECSVCKEYANKDSRIKFFNREHTGVAATRNFALKQVQGEYIAFVDSDDWIDSNMLQVCYDFAKEKNTDLLTMDFFETKNNSDTLRIQKPKTKDPTNILHQILVGNIFGGMPLRIIKKAFYNKHPVFFPEHIGYCEDILFWVQFLQAQPKIDYLNKAFYHYIQDNNLSITRDYTEEKFNERKKFIHTLKDKLPKAFIEDINMAAFNVKIEAMRNHLLTPAEYISFEKTHLHTLFHSSEPFITKIYLLLHTILLTIFNKTYKEYL